MIQWRKNILKLQSIPRQMPSLRKLTTESQITGMEEGKRSVSRRILVSLYDYGYLAASADTFFHFKRYFIRSKYTPALRIQLDAFEEWESR
jgi:hypothetical protein